MIGLKLLEKIIECTILSPFIKDDKPISLLIVAKAESGKTSAMKRYRKTKGIVYVTDCTAYGLSRDILPKVVSGEVRTIVIPDLLTPLSKQTKTRLSFIAFLNNLIEEGVAKITTYSMIWDKDVAANLITGITDEALRDARHSWAKMGFLSRFIIFSYAYDMSTIDQILKQYSKGGLITQYKLVKTPRGSVKVDLPEELADRLDPYAKEIGQEMELYGIRAKVNLRSLLKALAFRNDSKVVTEKEFSEFVELSHHFNIKFNEIGDGKIEA